MASHLLTQGKRSMAVTPNSTDQVVGGCAYRGDNGTRCVVGFCIKNEKYDPYYEGHGAQNPEVLDMIDDAYCKDPEFVQRMQAVHDVSPIDGWPTDLKAVANYFNLDSSIVDTFASITIPQPQEAVYAQ